MLLCDKGPERSGSRGYCCHHLQLAAGRVDAPVTDPALNIPVAMISKEDGEELVNRSPLGSCSNILVVWRKLTPNPSGGQVSDFSGWGPNPNLGMTPDIGAPGNHLLYSFPGRWVPMTSTLAPPWPALTRRAL